MINRFLKRSFFSLLLFSKFFVWSILLQNPVQAAENQVRHYLEANITANTIFSGGDRLENQTSFAPGFSFAHGSNITPVHALVMSYGKDYVKQDDAVLTGATFFLRRYMPKYSRLNLLLYSNIGSAYYRYEKSGEPCVLKNAGLIIGWGADWVYSSKLRFSLEADYRGFNIRQFGVESRDYIRPLTIFAGLRYYYLTTNYLVKPQK